MIRLYPRVLMTRLSASLIVICPPWYIYSPSWCQSHTLGEPDHDLPFSSHMPCSPFPRPVERPISATTLAWIHPSWTWNTGTVQYSSCEELPGLCANGISPSMSLIQPMNAFLFFFGYLAKIVLYPVNVYTSFSSWVVSSWGAQIL